MKKILFTITIEIILFTSNSIAEILDCSKFEKFSAKNLECKAKNLKKKSSTLKQKTVDTAKNSKKKFNKSSFKKKLIKFKDSKTLTKVMEK